jgi:hypothetical protein
LWEAQRRMLRVKVGKPEGKKYVGHLVDGNKVILN